MLWNHVEVIVSTDYFLVDKHSKRRIISLWPSKVEHFLRDVFIHDNVSEFRLLLSSLTYLIECFVYFVDFIALCCIYLTISTSIFEKNDFWRRFPFVLLDKRSQSLKHHLLNFQSILSFLNCIARVEFAKVWSNSRAKSNDSTFRNFVFSTVNSNHHDIFGQFWGWSRSPQHISYFGTHL